MLSVCARAEREWPAAIAQNVDVSSAVTARYGLLASHAVSCGINAKLHSSTNRKYKKNLEVVTQAIENWRPTAYLQHIDQNVLQFVVHQIYNKSTSYRTSNELYCCTTGCARSPQQIEMIRYAILLQCTIISNLSRKWLCMFITYWLLILVAGWWLEMMLKFSCL